MTLGRLLRTRARRLIAVAVVALVAVGVLVASAVATRPAPIVPRDLTIAVPAGPGSDGTIDLDASLYLPAVTPAPAVIVAHGFGGSKNSVADDARRLAAAGFVVLTYSARGFGASGGRIALDSLDYEVADARSLVDYLARQPEVTKDSPGDPRVGVTGGSYGGALSLMLAGTDPRVDAVAAVATWNNLQQALFPNNVVAVKVGGSPPVPSAPASPLTPAYAPAGPDGVFKQAWTASLIMSVAAAGSAADPTASGYDAARGGTAAEGPGSGADRRPPEASTAGCGRLTAELCAAYVQVATTGHASPAMTKLLARSSPAQVVSHITAPTLLVQGEQDTLFGLDQADANARAIAAAGTPVAVSWYPGGHSGGGLDVQSQDRITNWLRYYLAGRGPAPSLAFRYDIAGSVTQRGVAQTRTLEVAGYPALRGGATAQQSVTISGRTQTIMNPPGGEPAALTSLPGVGSLASGALGALTALPGQTAQFVSEPLTAPLVVTGSVTASLTVSRVPAPDAAVAAGGDDSAVLYVSLISADPAATAPGGGTAAPTASPSGSGEASASGQSDLSAALSGLGSGPAGGAVAPIRIEHLPADGTPVAVTVRLPAVAFQIAAGKALGVRVATTDQGFPASAEPAAYRVSLAVDPDSQDVARSTVQVPAVGGTRINNDENPLWWAVALGLVVLAGIVALSLAGRGPRRRAAAGAEGGVIPDAASEAPDSTARATSGAAVGAAAASPTNPTQEAPDGEDAPEAHRTRAPGGSALPDALPDAVPAPAEPLIVSGLRKQYPGGVTAVADVSFTVRRGQVLGLLGPNGAGKTTTLRMVMGLISPSAGEIRLFGEPVHPGAPVLARVGSFVEGAGFLPHLSGRANLDLYWRATGRPADAAFMDQALAIAGLGSAITRKVRTYSQGMRQRLAIAQAMLGLPELLLLDEPTNGLDPPQIHAMREVLRRYAATGRTVLISSHLLSEVEQTCTDVVIVSLGRTIATGSVAELVSHSGDVLVTTAEPAKARAALAALSGIGESEIVTAGLAVDRGTADVTTMLRALLDAGVPVTAIAPRNRLEEVFLDLISAGEGT